MSRMKEKLVNAGSDKPWENISHRASSQCEIDQLLKDANLDWSIDKAKVYADHNGTKIDTGKYALVRDDNQDILDVVSEKWVPVQNKNAFKFFYDFLEEGSMELESAGYLQDGRLTWMLAKTNQSFDLFDGDKIDNYLLFTNPHKYGKAVDIRFTPNRVVCNNMITKLISGKIDNVLRFNHSTEFDPMLARETLLQSQKEFDNYKEIAEFLGSKAFTEETIMKYFDKVFPSTSKEKEAAENDNAKVSRNVELAMSALDEQPGAEYARGSWWQALNAVTYLTDHVLGNSDETRLQSNWYGQNQTRKLKAVNQAIDFAKKVA